MGQPEVCNHAERSFKVGLGRKWDYITPVFFRPRSHIYRKRQTGKHYRLARPTRHFNTSQRWSKSGFLLGQTPEKERLTRPRFRLLNLLQQTQQVEEKPRRAAEAQLQALYSNNGQIP